MSYQSTKTYGHSIGLSCCFRQHEAESHCRFLHGYALKVRLVFEASELDHNGWVVDFGGLRTFRKWLEETFDHKLLVAENDPNKLMLLHLKNYEIADVIVVEATGCEAFAKMIYDECARWLTVNGLYPRVDLVSVEVSEHGANSALYKER